MVSPSSKSKPNLNLKTRKKPSVLFCEHFRLFRERKKEKKENNNLVWLSCVIFEFLHSVGLVGKRVDLWEFNHPRLQPLHDMIEIRRYIFQRSRRKEKNLHDPEIVPSVSLFSLFNDSEGIGFFFLEFFKLFPVHNTNFSHFFEKKNKTTSLNWSRTLCVSRTIIHDALIQKCKRKSYE